MNGSGPCDVDLSESVGHEAGPSEVRGLLWAMMGACVMRNPSLTHEPLSEYAVRLAAAGCAGVWMRQAGPGRAGPVRGRE